MRPHAGSCTALLLCLAACSTGPALRTYVLTPPLPAATVAPGRTLPTARIVISRVLVPDYLDTTDLLLRDGRNEVKVSATGRWGERLSRGLTRELTAELGARLPTAQVTTAEVTPDVSGLVQRRVLIDVNALDLWPDGRCVMAATWAIVDLAPPRAVMRGSGTFDASPTGGIVGVGDARLVDAVSRTAGKLADAIAQHVMQSGGRAAPRAD